MTGDLGNLPRRELGVDILGQALVFGVEPRKFLANIHCRIVLHKPQLLDLGFKLGDRLFEFQRACLHGWI